MEEKIGCASRQPKSINDFLNENTEIILRINGIVGYLKANISGGDLADEGQPSPTCMLELLDIQNHNLKTILENLEHIKTMFNITK